MWNSFVSVPDHCLFIFFIWYALFYLIWIISQPTSIVSISFILSFKITFFSSFALFPLWHPGIFLQLVSWLNFIAFLSSFLCRLPFPYGVWGRMWNSFVSVPDHCLFIFFIWYALFYLIWIISQPTSIVSISFILSFKITFFSSFALFPLWHPGIFLQLVSWLNFIIPGIGFNSQSLPFRESESV